MKLFFSCKQRGFFHVTHTFPDYKDKDRWIDTTFADTCENLLAQTTSDGIN